MGKTITFAELDTLSNAFGAWLQGDGLQEGRARRADDAQHPAIPGVPVRRSLRAGCTVVNVNPLYTPRELEHQLSDSGAEVDRGRREFRHIRCRWSSAKTKVRQVVVTSIGELLGFKGLIVDFVLRHVKKMVPALFAAPVRSGCPMRWLTGRRRAGTLEHRAAWVTTTLRSCSTPAARRAWPRARCCSIATSSPTCCRRAPGLRPFLEP